MSRPDRPRARSRGHDGEPDAGPAPRARRPKRAPPAPDRAAITDAYSWDEHKNEKNHSKHSVTFETATLVFEDPQHVTSPPEATDGEPRWQAVGMAGPGLMLLVIYTPRAAALAGSPDRIHILSARRVTKAERRLFETARSARSTQVLGHGATPADRGWFGPRGYRDRVLARRTGKGG